MNRKKILFGLFIFICSVTVISPSKSEERARITNNGLDPAMSAKIETIANEGMKKWNAPGLAIGIVKDGKLAWEGYFGYANIEKQQPVTETTAFRIGSISKTFTAVAIMQLVEQGKFKPDDPIDDFAPYPVFRQKYSCCAKPTFMNVFTHTSGGGEFKYLWQPINPKDPVLMMPKGKLRPDLKTLYRSGITTKICPGDKWAYCNYCVGALGLALENITGQSFKDYTDQRIFKPLGMNSSSFYETDAALANVAQGYEYKSDEKKFKPIDLVIIDAVPAGNIYTTVQDMSRYMIAMMNHGRLGEAQILKPETVDYMFAPHFGLDPRLPKMGVNFILNDNYFGHRVVGHNGGLPGFTSEMKLALDDRVGVIVVNNAGSSAPGEIVAQIFQVLFNYQEPAEIQPSREIWPQLEGRYVSPEPDFLSDLRFLQGARGAYRVFESKGKLYLGSNKPGDRRELRQVAKDDPYYLRVVKKESHMHGYILFKPGADGKAGSLILGLNEYVRAGEPRKKPCAQKEKL